MVEKAREFPQCLVPEPYSGAWLGGGGGMPSTAASVGSAVLPPWSSFGGCGAMDTWFGPDPTVC